MKTLKELTRPNVWALKPYSSARDEYSGVEASVFLDANENPYHAPFNRYPDPLQKELKSLVFLNLFIILTLKKEFLLLRGN